MNDEMFRHSLIEITDKDLLNKFVNEIFNYNLNDNEYIYIQYKIVNNNIILNIFDNAKCNRFKAYIFTLDNIDNDDKDTLYINIKDCYNEYIEGNINNKLCLLGALLMTDKLYEKEDIINRLFDNEIKRILNKHFI